jgi:hypothetical protein
MRICERGEEEEEGREVHVMCMPMGMDAECP